MISALHVVLAVAAHLALWRGLERASFVDHGPAGDVASAFTLAVLIASALGSVTAIVAGRTGRSPFRALLWDGGAFALAAWAIAVMSLGPWTRDLAGVFAVAIAVARLAPGTLAIVSGRAPAWLAFFVAAGGYMAMAAWLPVASLPFGDQIHYLLVADRLAHGSIATPSDPRPFTELMGFPPAAADDATHVAITSLGPRPIQGYALALAILPGWVLGGRLGVGLVLGLIAAWTTFVTLLILNDLRLRGALPPVATPRGDHAARGQADVGSGSPGVHLVGWTWLMATAFLPMALLATHVYPNMLGAALIATAFRWGFTAPIRRPAIAAAILALTLFLTPRDAIALVVLLPFLFLASGGPSREQERARRIRIAIASGAVLLLVVVVNAALYGLPIPYASYAFGTSQAQELTGQGSITAFIWVTLPAILFDRTFGLAGTAPWLFIGLIGLVPAIRAERAASGDAGAPGTRALVPAALAVGVSLVALSFFRLWEGGYAPPARYFVDVLPLWTPFVAAGLGYALDPAASALAARAFAVRAFAAIAIAVSAITSFVLSAVPALALNSAFDDKIRDALGKILGVDPLGWLPSFQPLTPTWYIAAYLRVIPAIIVCAGLVLAGTRYGPLRRPGPAGRELSGAAQSDVADGPQEFRQRNVANAQRGVADPQRGVATRQRNVAEIRGGAREEVEGNSGLVNTGIAPNARPVLFLAFSLFGAGLVVIATQQPWLAISPDPVPDSLYRKWLPLSLALATVATAVVARALTPEERAPLLRRHFLLFLVPLALMLIARFGEGAVVNGTLGAVYLLIAVGFVLNAPIALWPAVPRLADRTIALQLAMIALVAAVVLLPYHRAVMPTASDEPHYLLVTQSLLYDHDLDLANDYAGDRYSVFYPSRLPDIHGIEVGNAIYSIRDLGMPILAVVPYAIAGRIGVLAMLCLVAAALAAQLYLLARDVGFGQRAAFLATATTALTHPLFTYTTQIYPELLTALAFVSAARVMRAGPRATTRDLAIASALLGTLPWLSTRAWPIVVGAGLVLAWIALGSARGNARAFVVRSAAGALPFAALVIALCALNWRLFGLFLPSAGYFLIRENQPVLTFTPWIGAPGLLFDRVFGLIPRAPVYLLAFVGALPLLRKRGAELAAIALGSIFAFAYIADIAYWWADGSPPSRYALESLPLLVLAVAAGWEIVLARPLWRAIAAATVAISGLVVYLYAAEPNIRYDLALDVATTGSSGGLFTFVERATGVDLGRLFPSLVHLDALSVVLTLTWIGIAIGLVALGARATSGRVQVSSFGPLQNERH